MGPTMVHMMLRMTSMHVPREECGDAATHLSADIFQRLKCKGACVSIQLCWQFLEEFAQTLLALAKNVLLLPMPEEMS